MRVEGILVLSIWVVNLAKAETEDSLELDVYLVEVTLSNNYDCSEWTSIDPLSNIPFYELDFMPNILFPKAYNVEFSLSTLISLDTSYN